MSIFINITLNSLSGKSTYLCLRTYKVIVQKMTLSFSLLCFLIEGIFAAQLFRINYLMQTVTLEYL